MTGPQLAALTRRLAETPPDFLAPPVVPGRGGVHVAALVNDVALRLGGRLPPAALARFTSASAGDSPRLAVTLLLAWLLADDWFAAARPLPAGQEALLDLLDETAAELARATKPAHFVTDPERREELVRVALVRLGFRPDGETAEQATDRLSAISGTERRRLLEASRAAEARARSIREALARQAAQEAADKWTRE